MAKIKRIFFNGVLTYPMTITDAIIDTKTNKPLTVRLDELEDAVISGVVAIPIEDIENLINS
jgi:hypothetical protein